MLLSYIVTDVMSHFMLTNGRCYCHFVISGRCYCHIMLSGNIPLDLCVADVIATMGDGNAIKLIKFIFSLMLLPKCLSGRC